MNGRTESHPPPQPDKSAMLQTLEILFEPTEIIELRAFQKANKRVAAGYFDGQHRSELVEQAARLNLAGSAVYVTLNRIDPQLLGRYCNRIESSANATATDANVIRRRWLLLDFDPDRPKDTSVTTEQMAAATAKATNVRRYLSGQGWPEPIAAESGNGWHLLYPLDLPNDAESRDLVKSALAGLAAQFDDDVVKVDQSVFNAGRITKLYGSIANKGDHTASTPWRLSRMVSVPPCSQVVTPEQLRALHIESARQDAGLDSPSSTHRSTFQLDEFLDRLNIAFVHDVHDGRDRYRLDHCPFNPAHGKGEAAIFQSPDGKLGFRCQHNSCADKGWRDVRALVDGHRDETHPEDHATGSASRGAADLAADWPPPQPLVASIEAEEYPLDALPAGIQSAVQEAVDYLQAPVPLVAMSAISQLSLAVQAHADVYRDEVLRSPSSIYSLVVATSGERKTQADRLFSKAVEEYQDEQDRLAKPFIEEFEAREAAWKAEQRGILDAIKQAGKTGKSSEAMKARLRELEQQKPEAPRFPKLLRMDATPEGLAKKLEIEWPSAAIISNEAGIIFGSHGMGKDSAVRNMGLLNVFWDGSRFRADRADDERNRDVRGARLTMGLMIQEATLRAFFEQSNGLARGTGFLARFLVAWPTSTMGSRYYKPPAPGMPAVSAFNTRIRELLERPVTFDRAGVLAPSAVLLSPDAKEAWIRFHDAVEHDLRSGGELYDIKDVAAKIADNAARLSSLFAAFEFGFDSPIPYESFEGASRVAAWSLHESRRFFGELAFPPELANAARLERWLVEYCRREHSRVVPKNHVRQYATPISLRSKQILDAALTELESLNRIRLVRTDRRMDVVVSPAVLAGGGR